MPSFSGRKEKLFETNVEAVVAFKDGLIGSMTELNSTITSFNKKATGTYETVLDGLKNFKSTKQQVQLL